MLPNNENEFVATLRVKLKNKELDNQLAEKGFVKVQGLYAPLIIERLKDLYQEYHSDQTDRTPLFWNSMNDVPTAKGLELSERILDVIRPGLNDILTGFETPVAQIMSKNYGPSTYVNLHRDTTIFEEDKYTYINLWIPLVDATEDSGALFVVPYSHKIFTYPRIHVFPWHYEYLREQLTPYLVTVEAKAGDCIVFCDRMLHGSYPNMTRQFRPVVYLGAIPPHSQVSYYYYDEKQNRVRVYSVPDNFYFQKDFSEPVGMYPVVNDFEFTPPALTIEEVAGFLEQ